MADFNQKLLCLLTDFGPKGQHYIASMKAVILKINPNIKIIDISHYITPFSIIEASYILKTIYKYFPEDTIFVIVVDPGVGGTREIIALKTNTNHYFIGPNNGLFSDSLGDTITECVHLQNDEFFQKPVSNTFHGRDIMAPAGAYLLSGIPLNRFGPKFNLNNIKALPITYEIDHKKKTIMCIIQYIDSFGNGITNIPIINNKIQKSELQLSEGMQITVTIEDDSFTGIFSSHFSRVAKNNLIFLVGSNGFLEISLNQGNASHELSFNIGDIITIAL